MQVGPESTNFANHVLFAFLFVTLVIFFRRVSLSGKRNWDDIWKPVAPTLAPKPSPADAVRNGVTGLITWIFGWFFVILFLFLAFDQFFLGGELVWQMIDTAISLRSQ